MTAESPSTPCHPIYTPATPARKTAQSRFSSVINRRCSAEDITRARQDLWFHQVRDVLTHALGEPPGLRSEHAEELAELLPAPRVDRDPRALRVTLIETIERKVPPMVRKFPVAYGFALAAVLDALLVSGVLDWSETMRAAAITLVTALFTLGSALLARPIEVGVVSASLTTVVVALAAFNVNLDDGMVQAWLAAIVAVGGLLTHNIVSPPGGVLDRDPRTKSVEPVQ